jgi:uncharacterized protein (UPF0276 family)
MKRITIELKSKAVTSHVPLAAFGYALGRGGVLSPLHEVALPIKTLIDRCIDKFSSHGIKCKHEKNIYSHT